MAQVPNSSLPFNDNAVNGNVVTQTEWNQFIQVFQQAINDNFYRIVEQFNLLNSDGSTNKSMQVANTSGTTNVVQFEMGAGITISAIQTGGNITFTFSIANGAITESMLASGILQDVFYTQTQLNNGQLNNLYYTKSQVDSEINNASYTKTVQTGTSFPSSPTSGQEFYRTDLHQLYVYDSGQGQWNASGKTDSAGRFTLGSVDGSNHLWFGTGSSTEPGDLAFGWETDGAGNIKKIHLSAGNNPVIDTNSGTILDDGSGNMTVHGNLTVNGTTFKSYNQLTSPNAWISQG